MRSKVTKTVNVGSNPKRHFKKKHSFEYHKVQKKDNELVKATKVGRVQDKRNSGSSLPAIRSFDQPKSVTVKVKITNHEFKLHLIDLVVSSGVPLAMFNSTEFLGLVGETARQVGASISREGVRNLDLQRSEQLH